MKTSFVSNIAVQNAMRATISQGQLEMIKLQQEATTGTYADTGAALGSTSTRSINLKSELGRLENIKDTNSVVTQRLSASQLALDTMRKAADQISSSLLTNAGSDDASRISIAKNDVNAALSSFVAAANTQFNGEFLMSGVNTDVKPLTEYTATSPAKVAYDSALSTFMAANNINTMADFTPAQMSDFITNTLEPMYIDDASTPGDQSRWSQDWSDASDQNMMSRINSSEVVETSTNANSLGVRKFALAAVISSELLASGISSSVRATVSTAAQNYAQQSTTGLIQSSSTLGVSQSRVKASNTLIDAQVKLVKTHITDIEGVDPYEASTRLNTLKTQLETSYTLTAKLQQMSLINYL